MRIPLLSPVLVSISILGAPAGAQDASVFRVPGTETSVRVVGDSGRQVSEVSRDGGRTWTTLSPVDHRLMMRYREFDPAAESPVLPPMLSAAPGDRLFVVQFQTTIIPEFRDGLRAAGAEVHGYLPSQSYLVRMTRPSLEGLRALPYVRWVGAFHPAYRLDPELIDQLVSAVDAGAQRYDVLMVDKHSDTVGLEAQIADIGGRVETPAGGGVLIEATLTPAQVLQLAHDDRVQWIERTSPIGYDINIARQQAGVNYVETMAGIDGRGIRGHIHEGVYATHPEFGAISPFRSTPIALDNSGGSGHGTNTAGEIYSQGLSATARGILPMAQMIYSNVQSNSGRYDRMSRLVDPGGQYHGMMSTASWGNNRTTAYTGVSALMDDIIFDLDLFITQSQSNAGNRNSRPQAWAKNIASVGGFLHKNTATPADDCWCGTGSTGPARDGRIGVSFAAYYDNIRTTNGTSGYTNTFGGTSGATPIINGLGGAVIEMFTDGLFGYPGVTWQNRFGAVPHFTTTKALLAISTRQLPWNRSTRYQQGWGFPNLQDLYDNRDQLLVVDEEDVLQQGQSRTYYVWVKPETPELRVAMQYADPAANSGATVHRINSVDLWCDAPDGTRYFGNGGLLSAIWSSPGGEPNDRDTEECVFLQDPPAGLWTMTVKAQVVRQDGHVETAAEDVDFALAARNIGAGRDKSGMVLDVSQSGSGAGIAFDLTNVPSSGWTTGYTFLSLATSRHLGLGNFLGLELDSVSLTSLGLTPAPGGLFAFTNSGSPTQYPNATWQFPASISAVLLGQSVDAVVVLLDAQGNLVQASNVDRITVN